VPGNDNLWALVGSRMAASESSVRTDERVDWRTRGGLALMQAGILTLAILALFAALFGAVYSLAGDWRLWPSVALLVASIAVGVASALLAQNMINELGGHYWRQSPAESALIPALVDLLDSMSNERAGEQVARIIPYSIGGERHATSAAPARPVRLAREDARLLDFLQVAITRHIDAPTLRKMRAADGMQHYRLSQCKEPLNREAYEAVMSDLAQWGFVAVRPGTGAVWVVPPERAYRVLADEVERRRSA
jgi:hypothetical protein